LSYWQLRARHTWFQRVTQQPVVVLVLACLPRASDDSCVYVLTPPHPTACPLHLATWQVQLPRIRLRGAIQRIHWPQAHCAVVLRPHLLPAPEACECPPPPAPLFTRAACRYPSFFIFPSPANRAAYALDLFLLPPLMHLYTLLCTCMLSLTYSCTRLSARRHQPCAIKHAGTRYGLTPATANPLPLLL